MNGNLLIVGAGGHGNVVLDAAKSMGIFNKTDYLDDNSNLAIGKIDEYINFQKDYKYAFIALGDNNLRKLWFNKLKNVGYEMTSLIHADSYIYKTAIIEEGVVVLPKAVVSNNTKIKNGSIIGIGSLIDHDCIIGEFCHINSGAIIRPNETVDSFTKVDCGLVYLKNKMSQDYSFEMGV